MSQPACAMIDPQPRISDGTNSPYYRCLRPTRVGECHLGSGTGNRNAGRRHAPDLTHLRAAHLQQPSGLTNPTSLFQRPVNAIALMGTIGGRPRRLTHDRARSNPANTPAHPVAVRLFAPGQSMMSDVTGCRSSRAAVCEARLERQAASRHVARKERPSPPRFGARTQQKTGVDCGNGTTQRFLGAR